jgi:ATP-dependent Lhr-like helicase
MTPFHPATRAWFERAFAAPTPVQAEGWAQIAAGRHALLIAPTGSGKTLAAFLWGIDRLGRLDDESPRGVRVLYVSPLKALAYDVDRNLVAPLVGIGQAAARLGVPFRGPVVSVRTGDTPQKERQAFKKTPGDILVTTPESLYLLLGSQSREALRTVHTVIIDEVHALAPTKRGAHLALSLERLEELCVAPPQRIGLSATVRPPGEVARFLVGSRDVAVIDTSATPNLDLSIVVPVRDLSRPEPAYNALTIESEPGLGLGRMADPEASPSEGPHDYATNGMGYGAFQAASPPRGIWASVQPRILELILAHRSTIVFVNSRSLCERLARRLNELAQASGEPLVRAHHGSVSHAQRKEIEEALKEGRLRGIVATSSLELGIDMGAVDLVIQVESPGSTARGLQRVGRAGHQVGAVSRARIFPKYPGDLLEAAVVAERMIRGDIEPIAVPRNALDVLAQQIVAMTSVGDWDLDKLEATIHRTYGFADLSRDALVAVLDMLAGRYPSTDFADLRPRILWDRTTDVLSARKGSKMLALQNAGTIPDRGLFTVHLGPSGPRLGELDEEMVHESRVGETFVLGASTWRVEEITRDRVIVSPAPGQPGRMPFWHGDGPGRPIELGRAVGAFLRALGTRTPDEARLWLQGRVPLAEFAADNLIAYVQEQKEATGTLPTDRAITIERFRDELGDWRVCILTPFGARVHAPWALALEASLGELAGFVVRAMWSDDGIVLRLADTGEEEGALPSLDSLVPDPDLIEELVVEQVGHSPLFASLFRENAGRALLLPRQRVGKRTPLWAQRLRSQTLLGVARGYPSFPIVLETYRQVMKDHFDLEALTELLRAIRARKVKLEAVETTSASPFARSLVYRYVAEYLYDGDTPAAERRAQALTLDRDLLRDLLGQEELRDLLDAGELARLEDELQCLVRTRLARHPDGLADLLRRLGDLSDAEVAARCEPESDVASWLDQLSAARRVALVRIAGEARWIAAEDAGLVRDALGVVVPPGLPAAFLTSAPRPLPQLLRRYARTHGPFLPEQAAQRLGVPLGALRLAAAVLVDEGTLLVGAFRPDGLGEEWCAPEVLRALRRRTLARLRGEVEPVEAPALARFLTGWHGIAPPERLGGQGSLDLLRAALIQLEGLALPFGELEARILPARVPGFVPRMLDELGAAGEIVWVGKGSLGTSDGRIALVRRERLAVLLSESEEPLPDEDLHRGILGHLAEHGASFTSDLALSCPPGVPRSDLEEALWDLVWAGAVTNDTFAALRALGSRGKARRRGPAAAGGRWSLVARLRFREPSDTERAHGLATMLLERWGLVAREMASSESLPGGFSAVYKVLAAMEEAGSVRRGWFCEGLTGAQFAFPGAVDRLRASRDPAEAPELRMIAACDPANPYGAALPWPPQDGEARGGGPQRKPGATVVLVDGDLALWLGASGKRLLTFPRAERPELLHLALSVLPLAARRTRRRAITIERIDGEPASASARRTALIESGFVQDYRGLTLEAD